MNESRRPHTGRRRNEAARQAILDAAMRLLTRADGAPVTVDTLAAEAGVGKQTIYRWWGSKGAVFLEAMERYARTEIPTPDTGVLLTDLETFLSATFLSAEDPAVSGMLRALATEAAGNPVLADLLGGFTRARRDVLHALLERGRARGELPAEADLDLMVDQVYGLLWYRLLLRHRPFGPQDGGRMARALISGYGGSVPDDGDRPF